MPLHIIDPNFKHFLNKNFLKPRVEAYKKSSVNDSKGINLDFRINDIDRLCAIITPLF